MLREAADPGAVDEGAAVVAPWRVLRLHGELDCAQAESVRALIDETLAGAVRDAGRPGAGGPRIALDLGDVSFCDSYGLSLLVYAAKRVRERDGVLLVVDATRQVRMLIERCGLQRLLALAP